ncbi:MAG TPA: NlpC/P60 family protein [Chitinophagaceae bacterium]|nr:NlpC/P60 family protein [Chitinophagaceae bacterium]
MIRRLFFLVCIAAFASCNDTAVQEQTISTYNNPDDPDNVVTIRPAEMEDMMPQDTGFGIIGVRPDSILAFAKTLQGIPYLYASTDPQKGFDCSGFINYVFNHFHLSVPRSSVDFTSYGKEIDVNEAKPGDLILFTGTDSTVRVVGHMGIVESRQDSTLYFIHSSSGKKANGVVITPFERYYKSRFVKVIRVFADSLFY